jgi:hypothetical protein
MRLIAGLLQFAQYEKPIFIVGAPRSGTTMMFRLLGSNPALGSLPREGHNMWRMFHHPRYSGWTSDAVGSGEVRFGERRFISAYLYSYFEATRFVEKTPENSLRIPYLLDLFPDAHFVFIKRNPCDVVNSLINCWREENSQYRSYYVPVDLKIPTHPHRRQWRFVLFDGWQDFVNASIPEIAFEQWHQCVSGVLAGREQVPEERWLEVHLERLLAQPRKCVLQVLKKLNIPVDERMFTRLEELIAKPPNALSEPGQDKWRNENRDEISILLPKMVSLANALGYELNPETGDCEISKIQS